jgi:hypothetical protein
MRASILAAVALVAPSIACSSSKASEGPSDAGLKGPDFWTLLTNRTDLIPSGDVHPNAAGQEFMRQQWADVMAAIP